MDENRCEKCGTLLQSDEPCPECPAFTPVPGFAMPPPAVMAAIAQCGAPPEPTTAEAFATVRDIVDEMAEGEEDRPAWKVLRKDLAMLERRMGAMARVLRLVAEWKEKGSGGTVMPGPLQREVDTALTDAPPVYTAEEVEDLRARCALAAFTACVERTSADGEQCSLVADEVRKTPLPSTLRR